jgi:glycosyltransferase involved in cell wall biosynthesis
MHSIILTIHNKEWLVQQVLDGITKNTRGKYELIVVLDGCTDKSFDIVEDYFYGKSHDVTIATTPDVYETKANNVGLKSASGEYVIIVQDDMIIKEDGWNLRMQKPFDAFDDVFAVTSRTAHGWEFNHSTKHLGMKEDLDDCWCDICIHTNHADRTNISRDTFAVRASVNRGPLMINHEDLKKLNYLDEEFSPQDMDDHDLMYRMHKELDKVCGCYWIDFESKDEWGGTRVSGSPAPWLLKANHKNMKIFYERHKDLINLEYQNEDRRLLDG